MKLIASLTAPVVCALVHPVGLFLVELCGFALGLLQFLTSLINRSYLLVDFDRFRCGFRSAHTGLDSHKAEESDQSCVIDMFGDQVCRINQRIDFG